MPTSLHDPWFLWPPAERPGIVRVFCAPYAGGSAAVFTRWRQEADPRLEFVALQPPGRGTRSRERPYERMAPLAESLADAIEPYTDEPYALFGHSMGAAVSFEVARELRRRRSPPPVHLVVSARRGPRVPLRHRPLHRLDDDNLVEELAALNGTPAAVLADGELLAAMLPVIRADLAVAEAPYRAEPPLDCPITAFGGRDDRVTVADLEAWAAETRAGFSIEMFDGDHFFLNEQRPAMLQAIAERLVASAG